MKPVFISFSSDGFDQYRLGKVGGSITTQKGKTVFKFANQDQYNQYLALNRERYANVK